jgi:indole-3-glycerol phosphate synthase
MNSILNKITEKIIEDERNSFDGFRSEDFELIKRDKPIEIIHLISEKFFLVAEIKKASPSKGIIRNEFDPVKISSQYEAGGARAISVLTERNFFQGEKKYLSDVKKNVKLPVLRKDFIVHPYQVYESYNLGADFILLIAACLNDRDLDHLYNLAINLDMGVLIEIHDEIELQRVLKVKPSLIGINNRNLNTFQVNLKTSFKLKKMIPDDIHVISESGINTHEDIVELKEEGFSGALVGESLLRQKDLSKAVRNILYG